MENTKRAYLIVIAIFAIGFQSCLKDQFKNETSGAGVTSPVNFLNFDFKTVQEISIAVKILNANDVPIDGVSLKFYSSYPFDAVGQLLTESSNNLIYSACSGLDGNLKVKVLTSLIADSLYIVSNYVGLPSLAVVPIAGSSMDIIIGGSNGNLNGTNVLGKTKSLKSAMVYPTLAIKVNGYFTLGTWNTLGVPNYLEASNDVITNDLLASINTSLPEYINLTNSHPQYLAAGNEANIKLKEDAEVWVTFVHEGAGWTNSLGYYTYSGANPVSAKQEIKDMTLIYPNVSFMNSGGGLTSGNKVKLLYLDPVTNKYTSIFPKGINICWFMVSQGWNISLSNVGSGVYTLFSDLLLNPEPNANLKKHNVTLFYDKQNILLLGFEDVRRDQGSDNDFNDALFYATVNPITAVDFTKYAKADEELDTDKDGVNDSQDQYPNDPSKAYNNFYPSNNQFGSLVFEDLWPYKGDYDFNDMVVNYNFNPITNSKNEVVQIDARFVTRAIGASYHNAFGVVLPTTPDNVSSVTGLKNIKGYLNIASNGVEKGQSKATIIAFDDAYNVLPYPGSGLYVNTIPGSIYETPDTQKISIVLKNPVAIASFGTPPYNPFIIIDRKRGVEVHLPNQTPSDLADIKLLGTGQDKSVPGAGKYYVSDYYLPWALNLPVSFDYPSEKQDITKAYFNFNNWASSLGKLNKDWYLNSNNNRNSSLIYPNN